MVRKGVVGVLAGVVMVVFMSGCATTSKKSDLEIQGLKNQLQALETQLQEKDQEISVLRESLMKRNEEQAQGAVETRTVSQVSKPTMKQIQVALRNAGYNPGSIDGKKGRQTKDAIKSFQKANGLKADGTVGKQTWSLLGQYLYKKEK